MGRPDPLVAGENEASADKKMIWSWQGSPRVSKHDMVEWAEWEGPEGVQDAGGFSRGLTLWFRAVLIKQVDLSWSSEWPQKAQLINSARAQSENRKFTILISRTYDKFNSPSI